MPWHFSERRRDGGGGISMKAGIFDSDDASSAASADDADNAGINAAPFAAASGPPHARQGAVDSNSATMTTRREPIGRRRRMFCGAQKSKQRLHLFFSSFQKNEERS
jgi:hypothetical protein